MRCGTALLRLNARSGSQKRVCIALIPIGTGAKSIGIALIPVGIDTIPAGINPIPVGISPIPIDFALIPIGNAPIPIDFALIPIDIDTIPIGIRAKQARSAALAASILPAQAAGKQNNSAELP